jgi:[acyl-carrier-protein] S-malonyltransferase
VSIRSAHPMVFHAPRSGTPRGVAVFTGQGAQKAGMGKDVVEATPVARAVIAEASEALSLDLPALIFGADPRLSLTEYAQPAILAVEIALFAAAAEQGYAPAWFGGHSLGEYTALVAAGVIPLAQAVVLVRERGRRMQLAVPSGRGAMAAIIGESLDVEAILALTAGLAVDLANHNGPDQLVLSGDAADLDVALERLAAAPAGQAARARKLDVSAPFHSRLMAPIEADFQALLTEASASWTLDRAPRVACNVTGGFHSDDRAELVRRLVAQISGTVRWVDNMRALAATGEPVHEFGPNRVLRAFFRSVEVDCETVMNLVSLRRAFPAPSALEP